MKCFSSTQSELLKENKVKTDNQEVLTEIDYTQFFKILFGTMMCFSYKKLRSL